MRFDVATVFVGPNPTLSELHSLGLKKTNDSFVKIFTISLERNFEIWK